MRPSFFHHLHPPTIPATQARWRYTLGAGGTAVFLMLILGATGILEMFYYIPNPEEAALSVQTITYHVPFGGFIRNLHYWAAQLMVIFVVGHMLRVYLTASYKRPREFNWVIGVGLFALTMAFSLTGHLLPWDSGAFWSTTVTLSLANKVPIIGNSISYLMMGGEGVGAGTLTRFFSAHIMLLPAALVAFLAAHFWMIRKQGISGPL